MTATVTIEIDRQRSLSGLFHGSASAATGRKLPTQVPA